MKKQEKKREMRGKRFWKSPKTTSSEDSGGYDSPTTSNVAIKLKPPGTLQKHTINNRATCSLPLLQVWPSQDSPHGDGVDSGKSFIFPLATSDVTTMENIKELDDLCINDGTDNGENSVCKNKKFNRPSAINAISGTTNYCNINRKSLLLSDSLNVTNGNNDGGDDNVIGAGGGGCSGGGGGDSGIESIQASPLTNAYICLPGVVIQSVVHQQPTTAAHISNISPLSSPINNRHQLLPLRRPSSAFLHPDHARLLAMRNPPMSPNQSSIEDFSELNRIAGIHICAATSSSTTSSLTSIAATSINQKRLSDPWLHIDEHNRRRSSTLTARYSLFDALDLEYALLNAAARGSVGPYSLNESFHKLTFTQSLAFPALARGLATHRRRRSTDHHHNRNQSRSLNPNESGFNIFAKVVTAVVLMLVSFLVFLVIYKFVRT